MAAHAKSATCLGCGSLMTVISEQFPACVHAVAGDLSADVYAADIRGQNNELMAGMGAGMQDMTAVAQ